MALVLLTLWFAMFVGVPTLYWARSLEEARQRWTPRAVEREHVGAGAFRGVTLTRLAAEGPPRVVQLAAMGCWILGMMFVPGAIAGLAGVFFMGIGVISLPGLILAAKLFRLGGPLMRGDLDAPQRARDAAYFARVLNYIVLALCGCGGALAAWGLRTGIGGYSDAANGLAFCIGVALYAAVSLTHARLLERAATVVEQELDARYAARSGVRIDVQADEHPAVVEALTDARDARRSSRGE